MEIRVTLLEAGWLHQAALLSQAGQSFGDAKQARELGQRIAALLPEGEPIKVKSGEPRNIKVEIETHELLMLYAQLTGGARWPFDQYSDLMMDLFAALIDQMAEWLKDSKAKDAFDALPDAEKRKALAQAKQGE